MEITADLKELLESIEYNGLWESLKDIFPHIGRIGSDNFAFMIGNKNGRDALLLNCRVANHLEESECAIKKLLARCESNPKDFTGNMDLALCCYEQAASNLELSIQSCERLDINNWLIFANRSHYFLFEFLKFYDSI